MTSRVSDGGENGVKPNGEDRVKVDIPEEGSEMWQRAATNLLDRFQNRTDQFSITCFVSSEAPKSELDPVPYRYVPIPCLHSIIPFSQSGGYPVCGGQCPSGETSTSYYLQCWRRHCQLWAGGNRYTVHANLP